MYAIRSYYVTAGYQYDVGNMNDRRGIEGDVQQNAAPGVLFKLDMSAFFIRTGAEFSYPFEKGRVSSSVYNIEQTVVYFIEVPVYAGLRFPIRDFGEIYIGGGGSYIFSMGRVKTTVITSYSIHYTKLYDWFSWNRATPSVPLMAVITLYPK